jgi:hypothetical protein
MRNAKNRWVTKTGRCNAPGRVTRAVYGVRRQHDGKPLPIHLQCHPKALAPTPVNPGCMTYKNRAWGRALNLVYTSSEIMAGKGLKRKARFALVWVQGLKQLGCLADALDAMAYARHAATKRITLEVIDNEV